MSTFSQRLNRLAAQPQLLCQIGRGVEREALRLTERGELSQLPHGQTLGSALTHKWITTDFAEPLLEMITPVSHSVDTLLEQLRDIHHFTVNEIGDEHLWPMSMPCFVGHQDDIQLADYGSSHVGQMKHLYRQGLKNRYGSLMQIIAGVHFNFSLPTDFWPIVFPQASADEDITSEGYFALIRNYYRFGWLIPYLFGSSPALCQSFVKDKASTLPFEKAGEGTLYLPYATALRLSDLGYTNSEQSDLAISFNSLNAYLDGVRRAIHLPSDKFAEIGVKVDGEYRQLNTNILQIENELYAPIRPKRVAKSGEKPSDALARGGVEYIEVRALDVNPFSAVGLTRQQVYFLDLFLTWCGLTESEPMSQCEQQCWHKNWQEIILRGRQPDLMLTIGCQGEQLTQRVWGERVFAELRQIAELFDQVNGGQHYQQTCDELASWLVDPSKTLSARILEQIQQDQCVIGLGKKLAKSHTESLQQGEYRQISEAQFRQEAQDSLARQAEMEATDQGSLDAYLANYFHYLKESQHS
ncbi:Glutamate--cysteine ligase [Vibrio stylophorae]|uniref:Glutamate--cysteine ligase n=1 Tax=Vibrio stylophorae TaxID=659351 RepID=A0ABN8DU79_9VIBR|nr:glutamate--cysteine ligase [Vibrio stylophorae]CAH0534332.1 Glutamate--cysteine ligase [Vibrio stylophorae]